MADTASRLLWTVTLIAMGISQKVQLEDLGTDVSTSSVDFEGRIYRHDYDIIAIDEEHYLATAFYRSSHVMKKRARKKAA